MNLGGTLYAAGRQFDVRCVDPTQASGAAQGIRLYVVQGDQRVSVAQLNASGVDNSFSTSFGVPTNLAPGPALLVAQASSQAETPALASADFVASGSP